MSDEGERRTSENGDLEEDGVLHLDQSEAFICKLLTEQGKLRMVL